MSKMRISSPLMWTLLLVGIVLALPAAAQVSNSTLYSESFDTDLGTATAVNDAGPNAEWAFNDTCVAALDPNGHSDPGTARWGDPATCAGYGLEANLDELQTPMIDISECVGALTVDFNYLIDYARDNTFDDARVEATVDGMTTVVADNGDVVANLVQDASWNALSLDMSGDIGASTLQLSFIGEIGDGIANAGEGFFVDDVAVSCDVPLPVLAIPTLSSIGLGALVLLLATGALIALRRSRRTSS